MNSSATNTTGWGSSGVRTADLPIILATMPAEVQAAIKEVSKKTSAGAGASNILTTADKLFLLSEIEVFNSNTNSFAGEGSQYSYYANGGSTAKKLNNTTISW